MYLSNIIIPQVASSLDKSQPLIKENYWTEHFCCNLLTSRTFTTLIVWIFFCFVINEALFSLKIFFRHFYVRTLKMIWNIQKIGLEKSRWMCMCVCVGVCMFGPRKIQVSVISGFIQPIELKFGVHRKQTWPFL